MTDTLTRNDLVDYILKRHGRFEANQTRLVVNTFFDTVMELLLEYEEVSLPKFGVLFKKVSRPRKIKNINRQSDDHMTSAKFTIGFRPSAGLRKQLNGD